MKSIASYQLLLENLSQPVTLIDRDLNIIYSNTARNSQINSSASSLIGKKCYTVNHGFADPCLFHDISYCPAMISFEKNTKAYAIHKHLINDEIVVEEVFSTPFKSNEFVIHEFRNITNLLGLKKGILVVCSSCMRVRDKDGDWYRLDTYLHRQSGVDFSHSICSKCKRELYPDIP
jgi:PAS domain-containing protein